MQSCILTGAGLGWGVKRVVLGVPGWIDVVFAPAPERRQDNGFLSVKVTAGTLSLRQSECLEPSSYGVSCDCRHGFDASFSELNMSPSYIETEMSHPERAWLIDSESVCSPTQRSKKLRDFITHITQEENC